MQGKFIPHGFVDPDVSSPIESETAAKVSLMLSIEVLLSEKISVGLGGVTGYHGG